MTDDEVQFLGMRPASLLDPLPIVSSPHRPVTGIALHVESSEREPASRMLFKRTNTKEVQIGRRHSDDTDSADDDKALFGCPVVSRKHAILVFSGDTGNAYIMDKGSHHGTYMRRRGESGLPQRLEPEQSVLLRDGDQITLGKTVGRSSQDMVSPVIFRIELLYGTIDDSALDGSPAPVASNTGTPPQRISSRIVSRHGSGRFSAKELDLLDDDQDGIEVEQPVARRADDIRSMLSHFESAADFVAKYNRADDSASGSGRSSPMSLSSPSPRPESVDFPRSAPPFDESEEIAQRQRVDTQASWPQISLIREPSFDNMSSEDMEEDEQTPDSSMEQSHDDAHPFPEGESIESRIEKLQAEIDRLQAHRRKIKIKFNANTQTISRRLAALDEKTAAADASYDQFRARLTSVEGQSKDILDRMDVTSGHTNRLNERADGVDERMDEIDQQLEQLRDEHSTLEDRLEDDSDRISGAHDRIAELRQEIMEVDGRQEDLQTQYGTLKERQGEMREEHSELRDEVKDLRHRAVLAEEAHAALLAKHEALQQRLETLQQRHATLDCAVDVLRDELHKDLRISVQDLDERLAALSARDDGAARDDEQRATLQELIDEVKSIRAAAKQHADEEDQQARAEAHRTSLEAVAVRAAIAEFKQLHAQALAELARASEFQYKGPGPLSSKRKRHDEDEGIDGEGELLLDSQENLSLMSDASDMDLPPLTESRTLDRKGRPKTKRARQVGRTLARTAVTATVGAALTWTALAYC
ncbi:uncharacterized protein SCHCODRAFT_02629983 [Schizophyllum commune H4-8]|uniref:FHA domain-containing protein n=1 Tax=Schizophyllum commune (strain H4-8 / FGSC 9210) TaxID=578458 RepID=D8Q6V1_SCHCM|nr:uncharacterized protein SCHCODRAFT_02629983 [Schizophyllum commune H4-8]KAI5891758.1 hypothetical protein SCHCODRAFT_02629983 [Schizophyllum commune H4-8]